MSIFNLRYIIYAKLTKILNYRKNPTNKHGESSYNEIS